MFQVSMVGIWPSITDLTAHGVARPTLSVMVTARSPCAIPRTSSQFEMADIVNEIVDVAANVSVVHAAHPDSIFVWKL